MLTVDIIGVIMTVLLVGLRYPLYVIIAGVIGDMGRLLMILCLHGHIQTIVEAGAFGVAHSGDVKSGIPALLVMFSGSMTNYLVSVATGGFGIEKNRKLMRPTARVQRPFAVINMRLAILSLAVNLWQLLG